MESILARIVQRHGKAVLEDRRRTLGLLRDYAPNDSRGIRLLMTAYDMDVPKNLMSEGGAASEFKIEQEVGRLVAESGLQSDIARWAVSVWSSALLGTGAVIPAPSVAAPATAAAPAARNPAEDLTWDDEMPTAKAAAGAMPPIAPSAAVSSPAATTAAANLADVAKKPVARYGLIAIAIIVGIGILKSFVQSGDETPTTTAQPAQPAQPARPAPQQPAQPRPQQPAQPSSKPSEPNLVIASTSDDASNWPQFPDAAHPNNNSDQWQFQFNVRISDGRIFAYNVFVAMEDPRRGTGSVRALDMRNLNGGADKVSSTPSLPVTRELESKSKLYFNRIVTSSWAKNPSSAPDVCVIFSSGNQQRFNPEKGVFCTFEFRGGTCGQKLGCGRLQ